MKNILAALVGLFLATLGLAAQSYTINAEPYVITVTVTPQVPQAVISASPNSGTEPLATTITWSSVNATSITVKLDGKIISASNAGSYSINNLLAGTHTAEIAVTGPGGSATDSITINVAQALDPDVQAYVTATGATDVTAVNALISVIKANNRWNNFAALFFKSAQNYSSGTTVKGIGGLATDATLFNGATIAADGVTFDGVNDYGTWAPTNFRTWNAVTRISRSAPALASQSDAQTASVESIGQSSPDRSWSVGGTTVVFSGEKLAAYIVSNSVLNRRTGISAVSWTANEDHCLTMVAPTSSEPKYWKNTTALTPLLTNGSSSVGIVPANSGYTVSDTMNLSAFWGPSSFVAERRIALLYFNIALPDAEVVQYINLANAL